MDTTAARRILTAEFQRQGRDIATDQDVDHYARKMLDSYEEHAAELVEEYWDGQDDGQDDSVDTINRAALVWLELV